ncbi:hypothetical protein ElyMa_000515600 [Elysia marginata]|uniref:Uncharacterized protein n=1 Tax=Elysia marginata TaxID=1093978 RepID=A0AAV4FWE8_9GAST|nr:hypothetical protein ElyMa_000515600 [Elysia marginata]
MQAGIIVKLLDKRAPVGLTWHTLTVFTPADTSSRRQLQQHGGRGRRELMFQTVAISSGSLHSHLSEQGVSCVRPHPDPWHASVLRLTLILEEDRKILLF